MSRRSFIIKAAIVAALVIAIPFVCNEKLEETYYSITSYKLNAPVKLAFISDLHNTAYGEGMNELIDSIDGYSPDAVIFGGDLFDMYWNEENSVSLIKKLVAEYPCYYALGNHEFKYSDNERIISGVKSLGLKLLEGEYDDLTTANGGTVRIIGINGLPWKEHLDAAQNALSENILTILLNHYPEDYSQLKGYGFDLILSGHAHGGQWRLPPFINGVFSPGEGFFPKYTAGLYDEDGCKMIVSRGLQRCWRDIIVPRIFNRPEIVYITITPK